MDSAPTVHDATSFTNYRKKKAPSYLLRLFWIPKCQVNVLILQVTTQACLSVHILQLNPAVVDLVQSNRRGFQIDQNHQMIWRPSKKSRSEVLVERCYYVLHCYLLNLVLLELCFENFSGFNQIFWRFSFEWTSQLTFDNFNYCN